MANGIGRRIFKYQIITLLVLLYILFLPLVCAFTAWRRMRRKRRGWVRQRIPITTSERENWLRLANAPKKLPSMRKRELTIPLPDPDIPEKNNKKKPRPYRYPRRSRVQDTDAQPQSKLLSVLPPEIRMMIWQELLGGQVFHIVRMHKRLGHTVCDQRNTDDVTDDTTCCRQYFWTPAGDHYRDFPDTAKPRQLLGILKTCRIVYSETIDVLYGANTFSFRDLDAFLDLRRTIRPARQRTITSVRITWNWDNPTSSTRYSSTLYAPYDKQTWTRVVEGLALLPRLSSLRLDLRDSLRHVDRERENTIFEPLCDLLGFGRVPDFEVRVGWVADGQEIDLEALPFRLSRRGVLDVDEDTLMFG